MRLLLVLIIGVLFYFFQNLFFRKNWYKGLDVNVGFEKNTVREGDRNTLIEVVKNDKFLPLPVVLVKFSLTRSFLFPRENNAIVTDQYYRKEYFTCRPYQVITRKYSFVASKRGEYRISSVDVICRDFFLAENVFAGLNRFFSVLVLPGRIKEGEIPRNLNQLTGEIISRIKLLDDPFEFRAIREYQPYDPIHHVNWKATAKSETLQVNTFHTTNKRNVVILLNMETGTVRKSEVIAEAAIKIASFLADRFITEQISTALYSNGTDADSKEMIAVEAGSDEGHIRNIDVALAKIEIKELYTPFTKILDERITEDESENEFIIISNYRKEDLVTKVEDLKRLGHRISMIIPEYNYAPITPLAENGYDTVKWGIDEEG